jgi:hypothetical protein
VTAAQIIEDQATGSQGTTGDHPFCLSTRCGAAPDRERTVEFGRAYGQHDRCGGSRAGPRIDCSWILRPESRCLRFAGEVCRRPVASPARSHPIPRNLGEPTRFGCRLARHGTGGAERKMVQTLSGNDRLWRRRTGEDVLNREASADRKGSLLTCRRCAVSTTHGSQFAVFPLSCSLVTFPLHAPCPLLPAVSHWRSIMCRLS